MQRLHAFLGISIFATSLGLLACDGIGQSCTLLGCGDPYSTVQFSFTEPGAYVFDVTVDGKAVRCFAPMPLREGEGGCDDSRVILVQSGTLAPEDRQSLGPIEVSGDDVQRIEVKAFRGTTPIGTAAFDVKHTESAGPNGPGCDPDVCRSASGGDLK